MMEDPMDKNMDNSMENWGHMSYSLHSFEGVIQRIL